ncbi:MAG: DUF222 domain-containing protein [Acidimicrobiia bacterium]
MFDSKSAPVDLVGTPPEIEPADLVEELDAVLARITREEAKAAEIIARVVETEAFRRDGYSSATAMLKHRNAMHPNAASQMVGRARNLSKAPLVSLAYSQAAISTPQVDALLHASETAPEPFSKEQAGLVEMAMDTPLVDELRKRLNYWMECVAEDEIAWQRAMVREARSLRIRRDGEMVRISGWFDAEAGETLLAALEPPPPAADDRRSVAVRRADQLMDVINGSTQRPNLTVHVSAESLFEGLPGLSETSTGVFLNTADIKRLACDSIMHRVVFGPDSVPLDVGRAKRFVTPAMRKAVDARDLRCVFPGCDRPAHWCDAHHIVHWIDGGETCVMNLVLLCRHHHTLIHDHGWRLEGEPGSLRFFRPDGTEWAETLPDPPPLPRQRGPILDIETIQKIGALKQQLGRASPD